MGGFGTLIVRWGPATLVVASLGACSGWEPIEYHETSNIPEGPGLISGEKGGWTTFRIEENKKPKAERTAESDGRPPEEPPQE